MQRTVFLFSIFCFGSVFAHAQTKDDTPADRQRADARVSASATRSPDEPIPTRQRLFSVPFTVNAQGAPPKEVQLLVSGDQGANWHLYNRQPPTAKKFAFRAARDGEYWFGVRTIDKDERSHPEGKPKPGLKVLIDTSPPKIELKIVAGKEGDVSASWNVFDVNLSADSFKIEYQPEIGGQLDESAWRQVEIELPRDDTTRSVLSGTTTWLPATNIPALRIRARATDRAGNVGEMNRRVIVTPQVVNKSANTLDVGSEFRAPQDPFVRGDTTRKRSTPWPADNSNASRENDAGVHGKKNSTRSNLAPREPTAEYSWVTDSKSHSRGDWHGALPQGQRLHMTNSQQINLNYDVDSVGQSGVAKVELWATRDSGRTWQNWGTDPDRESPFPVKLDSEGVYGFRIVITSGVGFSSRQPRAGDLADIWIGVDLTKPTAQIDAAPFTGGSNAGELDIRWTASDLHLTDRPITLRYGESPDGPWSTIVGDAPNTGQYKWRIDPNAGREIYLRLEVRDEAGNVAIDQTTGAISIEGLSPKGRIRNFEPIRQDSP